MPGTRMVWPVVTMTLMGMCACRSAPQRQALQTPSPPQTQAPSQPQPEPEPEPPAPTTQAAVEHEAGTAAELLDRLERADDDLRDFQARITYYKWDAILKRREIRDGEVLYENRDGSKRFAILITRVIVQGRARNQRKTYIFDASWLVEIDHDTKMFIKRQIVPPGRQFDPVKLGEGPFPLPLGQPADEVLARFEVALLDHSRDERLAAWLKNADALGLLLTPRAGAADPGDFTAVELFYDRDTLLPLGVHAVNANGDTKTVRLRNGRSNKGIDPARLDIDEPDARDGWRIDVQPWQR